MSAAARRRGRRMRPARPRWARRWPGCSRARPASRSPCSGRSIGVGALVATLGLSKTAANQIVGRFDALAATDVVVSPSARAGGAGRSVLPWDAEARLQRLNGVVAAGTPRRRRRARRARALGAGQRPARSGRHPAAR